MRRGISLTEILVALFIMALGTIAILTLFPMGLITMGQALKDDRATQSAHSAEAYMRWYWKEQVLAKPNPNEPFFLAMNNPGGTLPVLTGGEKEASYPVFVDPMGAVMGNGDWIGAASGNQTNVPRRSISLIDAAGPARQTLALRTCSLLDTLGYDDSGKPLQDADMRSLPYNWAWMIQRTNNSEQFIADFKVLVYDKRVHLFQPSAMERAFVPTAAQIGLTSLTFASAPNVQKGGWLLDVSSTSPGKDGVRNANFYRVVSVTQNGGTVNVELQTPLKNHSGDATGFSVSDWRFVVMDGLYEVFDLPPLTR